MNSNHSNDSHTRGSAALDCWNLFQPSSGGLVRRVPGAVHRLPANEEIAAAQVGPALATSRRTRRLQRVGAVQGGCAALLLALAPFSRAAFSDGSLDPAFSGDGLVQTDFGNGLEDQALAVAVQPDGKTVAAGHSVVSGKYQVALARYTVTGSLDSTFGTGGRIRIDVGPDNDAALAVAVQPDGKIVIAGYAYSGSAFEFLVMRFTAAGALDSTFGTGGKATLALSSTVNRATALALQPDGKIVVAGFASIGGGQDFVVLRYTPSGALDSTFSGDGIAFTNLGGSTEQATSVLVQPDGKIVAAGFSSQGAWLDMALVRYTDAGALDGSFGTAGKAIISISPQDDLAYGAALSPEGGILLTGSIPGVSGYTDLVIARCTASGVLDTGFGATGFTRSAELNASMVGRGLALQSDGKILFTGSTTSGGGRILLGRLNPAGAASVDITFSGGLVRTPVGTGGAAGNAVALHADGRVAVAGVSNSVSGGPDFTVAIYGVPRPEIAVAVPAGPLTDGTGNVPLGAAPAGFSPSPVTFTITNPGTGPLMNLAITKGGANAAEFTVSALSATTVAPGGSATFTATFTPASPGTKSATLHIASNAEGAANPFDIALTAQTLTTSDDTDGDGLNDVAEFRLAALGFDWQTAQPSLVQLYQTSAPGAGLFRPAQVQSVAPCVPLLTRQPGTNLLTLKLGLESATGSPPTAVQIPLTASQTAIQDGQYSVQFPLPGDAAVLQLPAP